MTAARPTAAAPQEPDGRRRRSLDSRERIVRAMLDLVRGGEVSPSAEQVAARAGVGLRSVFRHFRDMDSLYREMSQVTEAEIRSTFDVPFTAADWRGRLVELVRRRAAIFERIAPFIRASDANRHRSPSLGADKARMAGAFRERLERLLPARILADGERLEALDLLLSYESWARLRAEQGLDAARATAVIEAAVARLSA
jgi:AcrR family transcriptional regulator